jgi:hypothetical protein
MTAPSEIDLMSDTYAVLVVGSPDYQVTDTEWVITGLRNYNAVNFTPGGVTTEPYNGHIF